MLLLEQICHTLYSVRNKFLSYSIISSIGKDILHAIWKFSHIFFHTAFNCNQHWGRWRAPPFNIKKHVPKNLYDFFVIDFSKNVCLALLSTIYSVLVNNSLLSKIRTWPGSSEQGFTVDYKVKVSVNCIFNQYFSGTFVIMIWIINFLFRSRTASG